MYYRLFVVTLSIHKVGMLKLLNRKKPDSWGCPSMLVTISKAYRLAQIFNNFSIR